MNDIFIGDIWGTLLSMPIALFLVFWLSNVRNKIAVIAGAIIGILLGFFGILFFVGTLVNGRPLTNVNGIEAFFSSLLLNSALGLIFGIVTDLVIVSRNERKYRRQEVQHE